MYDVALLYRTYRLTNTDQSRSFCGTGKVRNFTQRMDLKLKHYYFSAEDHILILEFLTRLVRKANIQEMSEALIRSHKVLFHRNRPH